MNDKKVYRQKLLFLKEWYQPGFAPKARPVACEEKPDRIWTLIGQEDEDAPPSLPLDPETLKGSFHESYIHDWSWNKGSLNYYSRVIGEPTWILLEYEEKEVQV